eukprot:CAMPEP_0115167098 /NCGR_PEP_ID=MMETSP0270-20121206/30_1 /TAXON_ID=71861 /ORGANISM="Scrippsiella trochoidea, Strain CCMP3099" /LENGTH=382 /DNA_ID=CAMNT_0002579659 /DNA_START=77 /DNA_END=1221 /DNA_ORIENTATION=-
MSLIVVSARWAWLENQRTLYPGAIRLRMCPDSTGHEFQSSRDDEEGDEEFEAWHPQGYRLVDVLFVIFHVTYQFCISAILVFALLTDGISRHLGILWELYAPWLLELLLSHLICAFLTKASRKKRRNLPLALLTALVGDRLNTLKDLQALAIYISIGTPLAWVCFVVSSSASMIAKLMIYSSRSDLVRMRLDYWPTGFLPEDDESDMQNLVEWFDTLLLDAGCSLHDLKSLREAMQPRGFVAQWPRVIEFAVDATSGYRQRIARIEQVPQTFTGLFFSLVTRTCSAYVLFNTLVTMTQALLVTFLRPYLICWTTLAGKPPRAVRLQAAVIFCKQGKPPEANYLTKVLAFPVMVRLIDLRWEPEFRYVASMSGVELEDPELTR